MRDWSRREFCQRLSLAASAAALGNLAAAGSARADWDPEAMTFLREIAAATVAAAHVPPGAFKPDAGVNTTGATLITPGGNYPAFWIRDYAMSLDCGLIDPDEMLPLLRLIARCQSGARERRLWSGGVIPPFSIPDHIRMDGRPVFYPGTYNAGQFQGADPWGPLPPADDHFYFVHVAWAGWRDAGDAAFLAETVSGLSILDRLIKAFNAPAADPQTGAVVAVPPRRAVGFGFNDTVYMLGAMCFATLLRWRAANELAELCAAAGRSVEAKGFREICDTIAANLVPVFADPGGIGGWLGAATVRCRQPDVWATLYALHLGVLPPEAERRARDTVAEAAAAGGNVIEYQGAVRQVPTTHDFSSTSAWEDCRARKGEYQNGAYWHTATGWLIAALSPVAPDLARGVFDRFITHLREHDFRKSPPPGPSAKFGAPWECFGLDLDHAQNPVYMTSIAAPLAVLRGMVG
jgi:hypothetical protein